MATLNPADQWPVASIDTQDTSFPVCPYCGTTDTLTYFERQAGANDCEACGAIYELEIRWTAEYTTRRQGSGGAGPQGGVNSEADCVTRQAAHDAESARQAADRQARFRHAVQAQAQNCAQRRQQRKEDTA